MCIAATPTGGAVDAVAAAFGWMANEHVAVINVSLVGPRNALLERVVKALVSRGHLIVAAVGNDGPAAPPLYPAAYDGVIGVTAVDAKHRVLLEACRGKHVDFAAPGRGHAGAASAPDVLRAGARHFVRRARRRDAVCHAISHARSGEGASARSRSANGVANDLGKPGRDEIYGVGELGDCRDPALGNMH